MAPVTPVVLRGPVSEEVPTGGQLSFQTQMTTSSQISLILKLLLLHFTIKEVFCDVFWLRFKGSLCHITSIEMVDYFQRCNPADFLYALIDVKP